MLKFFQNNKNLIAPALTLFVYILIGTFVYFAVFSEDYISVSEIDNSEKTNTEDLEIHPVSVALIVDNGNTQQAYSARLTDKDRVTSLIEYHYENSGLTFTKLEYTYGVELDNVNGLKAPEGYEWKVYDGVEEITYSIRERFLEDSRVYTIRLEKIEPTRTEELQ